MNSRVEKFFSEIKGKRVFFCGIGGSHMPLIKLFAEKGAAVTACDRRSFEKIGKNAEELQTLGIRLQLGEDYLKNLDADIIFRTPGMKYYTPELVQAREKGIAVTSEMEMFFDLCPCKIYGITGSDGKTTTSTIIAELLRAAGKRVHLGGNIGRPLLPEIERIDENDAAVVELSSFQLISMRKSPDVAVITNITPNHLDVHGTMEEYIQAKKNIFLHQGAFSRTVLNLDNEITAVFRHETRGQTLCFSKEKEPSYGFCLKDQCICRCPSGERVLPLEDIRIPGMHNVENYMAAISAVWGEVPVDIIRETARTFAGVAHRNELVRVLDGVAYYNDSIGTSPTRTIRGALSLYAEKIILIAGGYDKKIPFEPLGPVVVQKVKTLILMGATADKIEAAVKNSAGYETGCPQIIRVSGMEEAVATARAAAAAGDRVVLSPACASFDLYPNFEARGNHFKKLVNSLHEG